MFLLNKKIAFVMYSHLSMGAGTENTVIQYVKNMPPDWEATIFQADSPLGTDQSYLTDLEGLKVDIVSEHWVDHKFNFLTKSKLTLFISVYFITPFLFRFLRLTKTYREFRKKLKDFDIIYVFNNNYSSFAPKGPQVIGTTHGWSPIKSVGLKGLQTNLIASSLMWRRINVFHTFKRFEDYLKGRKAFSVESGVDTLIFKPAKIENDHIVRFVYMARLEECKGIILLLNAFKLAFNGANGIELHVMGLGPLQNLVKGENVFYHGFLSKKDQVKILQQSDCFVYPTSCDTFSLSVLESLACGLHVIVSDLLKGNFDTFSDIGMLEYHKCDVYSFSEAMKQFVAKKDSLKTEEISQREIINLYEWPSVTAQFFNNLYNLLK